MKKIAVGFVVVVALCLLVAADRTGLYQAFLQGNLDGGGQSITNLASLALSGTTNQIAFGATNTLPVNVTNPATWISVQIAGDTNVYRLGVYK